MTVNMGPIRSGHGRLGEPGITSHPGMAQGRRDHLSISKYQTMSSLLPKKCLPAGQRCLNTVVIMLNTPQDVRSEENLPGKLNR